MPLTARLSGHGTLDATLDGLGAGMAWEAVYRVRPRPVLACTDCGLPMHAKVSGRGGRFFAHDRRSATCAAVGETEEHRALKRALAAAAREAGIELADRESLTRQPPKILKGQIRYARSCRRASAAPWGEARPR
ncbi:hypothetical protein ACWGJ0_26495 [Streptomyces massasporeus]